MADRQIAARPETGPTAVRAESDTATHTHTHTHQQNSGRKGTLHVCVCVCVRAHAHGRQQPPRTRARTVQKSQITHKILMAQRNQQKSRRGRQEEEEEEVGDGKVGKSKRGMEAIWLHKQVTWMSSTFPCLPGALSCFFFPTPPALMLCVLTLSHHHLYRCEMRQEHFLRAHAKKQTRTCRSTRER